TNIVMVEVSRSGMSAADLSSALGDRGVKVMPIGPQVLRFVTHCDVGQADVDTLVAAATEILAP
ncbi:MAG: low specificity L-threonine aldolase, partial [Planctomycetota bacterium]|nr:low specificity L-threonine aldolase [Planctomycetota bacterium]